MRMVKPNESLPMTGEKVDAKEYFKWYFEIRPQIYIYISVTPGQL